MVKNSSKDAAASPVRIEHDSAASCRPLADHDQQAVHPVQGGRAALKRVTVQPALIEATPEAELQCLFSLLNELPGLVYLRAPDYTIRFANRHFQERFGNPGTTPCYELIRNRTTPCEPCSCATGQEGRQLTDSEWSFPDGTSYQLHDYLFVDVNGREMVCYLGIDITKGKQAEVKLEQTNRELLALSQAERKQRVFAEGLAQAVLALNSSLDLAEVLDRILEQTRRVIPYRAAMVMLLEDHQVQLARQRGMEPLSQSLKRLRAGVPLHDVPLLGTACRKGRPVLIPDVMRTPESLLTAGLEWVRSLAAVPMIQGEDVIGLIALFSEQPGFFARGSIRRLEAFATHAVLAIQNARLYQAGVEAARTTELLNAASRALGQALDLDTVLNDLLDMLAYLVPYERGVVYLAADNARLVPRAWRDRKGVLGPDACETLTVDAEMNSHLLELLTECKSIWLPDTSLSPSWQPRRRLGSVDSYIAVPLSVQGRAIGMCELMNQEAGAFSQEHLWWAEALSTQAAVAVHNAQLFERMRESREQLKSLSRRLVEVQENERRYIAAELHDEAVQSLISLRGGLERVQRQANDPHSVRDGTAKLLDTVEEVMENLRRLVVDLRPASLDHLGLVTALDQYCEIVGRHHGLATVFEARGLEGRMSVETETVLYRIVQEALTNVVLHARASQVDVRLERQLDVVVAIIQDDGSGFDPRGGFAPDRLGLLGMEERATSLGGTLAIKSTPHAGTSVIVKVPYVQQGAPR